MDREKLFLYVLLAIVTFSVFVIVRPFLEYVLLALLLAYVLFPLHLQLRESVQRRLPSTRVAEIVSAVTLILASFVVLIIPILYILTAFLEDLRLISRGETDLQTALIERKLAEIAGVDVDIQETAGQLTEFLFSVFFHDVSHLIELSLHVSLGVALVLFLVFYLLLDGPALVAWLTDASPLSPGVSATLVDQIDRTTWGAVVGHAFAAVVQALVAGLGLYLAGISNVVFWTIVMMVLAFLPLIGVFVIWAPAASYLFLIDETGSAIFLTLYGITVVSFIDYYVRPIVIDKRARLNPAVILVGVFGGVYTLGFVGLFVGPILIGIVVAILETFRQEYRSSAQPELDTSGDSPGVDDGTATPRSSEVSRTTRASRK
ncbi:AI-2E family transporter [Natrarchaeobius chitinivorans]|uniref:AI-2E family transporter n=1 Tax=Natrarchaeobius chitinivorans TaxID=1679083 RepID=A0A3N6NFP4_NATCH|nr:AI-2E family transporter [Natrarchaeobius chitinivorans]RQG97802.1 AI-2E family transporter [Natrarchaeobius chitinivorans]